MSSLFQRHRGAMRTTALVTLILTGSSVAFADAFDPPATYYDSTAPGGVPLVGAPLKSALTTITNNAIFQDYGYARFALDDIDADLDNPGNVMLVYNGASVSGMWDSGSTWNREHTWPRSLGVGDSGADNSDLHQLRPCNPGLNSSRGNKPFGPGGSYWDPGAFGQYYRGEMARAMFYMETRYTYLTLVDGFPSGNQMGDLRYLLRWHYEEAPDFGERRRNQEIYDHHQSNRNPYVDRPEFVWAIWGDGPNDSTLHVGASPAADGSSSTTVDVGVGLVGAPFAPVDVTITKLGDDPTTFEVILAGDASSPMPTTRAASGTAATSTA
jgi:endonuclease I